MLVSVSSSTSWSGGSPESRSATRTSRTSVSAAKCRALTLTDIRSGRPWRPTPPARRVVSRSSHRVIGMTCPVSSATERNSSGGEQPALGVLPPDQGLHALHRAGVQPDDRLVVDHELVDRVLAQPGGHLEPPAGGLPQRGGEQMHPVPARALRRVHRRVGVAEQQVGVAAPAGPTATPMLAVSGTEMPGVLNGRRKDVCRRKASAAASDESQPRATTTNWSPPSRPTASPGRTCSDSRPATWQQQRVGDLVAQRVVDGLEPVQVEHEQRRCRAASPASSAAPMSRSRPLRFGQPGQLVVAWPARPAPARRGPGP